jgi:type IV pilus assembly protein PilY1
MILTIKIRIKHTIKSALLSSIVMLFAANTQAALTDLGNAPLVTTTTGDQVLPNLMYILDNSGSMSWDFMPDNVGFNTVNSPIRTIYNNKCKDTNNPSGFSAYCQYGDPPYNANFFNSIYYNPDITYLPAKDANGVDMVSMTAANTANWTSVPNDAYDIQSTSNTSLIPTSSTTGYLDFVWCNTNAPADLFDPQICRNNTQYIYPNNTGNQSTSFNIRMPVRGYPFYYTVSAGEYCTDTNLTSCITATAPTTSNPIPARLRWCTNAANVSTGLGCQGKYNETSGHTFARWSGIKNSNAGAIKINADTLGCGVAGTPSCTAPSPISITNITVNGVSIIAPPGTSLSITNTTSLTQRSNLADAISDAINNIVSTPIDYVATSVADEVTILPVSGTPTGNIALTFSASPTVAAIPGNKAVGGFTITRARSTSSVTNIRVAGIEIMNQTQNTASSTDTAASRNALATLIVNRINTYVSSPDYEASSDGASNPRITITAKGTTAASNGTLSVLKGGGSTNLTISSITNLTGGGVNGVSGKTYTIPTSIAQFTGSTPVVTTFRRVDITPFTVDYPKATTRSDCAAPSTCTYDEEMTNFANWYSYYRTRMQMMKTSTSRAFAQIDSRFRVGFMTIARPNNSVTYPSYLPIAQYTQTQKNSWYNLLFNASPSNPVGTPLREALTIAGRIFAGKGASAIGNSSDPIQYSCQQNFSLLTTDGYWNGNGGLDINGASIGNLDGGSTPRPLKEGTPATSDTLADAAKYYYDTDLRTGTAGSAACTGAPRANGTTGDVCNNNVFVTSTDNNVQQHMTTFTLGLGVDATLNYSSDYKVATEGDFYELGDATRTGTKTWPTPAANAQTAVDDLWHAAVNGQGTYFSARDPNQLSDSLNEALNGIKAKVGAGAAAATSTLNPVANDNFSYVASYTSVKWIGNLEARTINTATGKVSQDASWCVENVIADTCILPSSVVLTNSNNSTIYECVTPNSTAASCTSPGAVLDGANNCRVEISTSCTGTLQSMVSDTADTRTIYMNVNGALGGFTSANLTAAGKDAAFTNSFLSAKLTQFNDAAFTAGQRALVNSNSLVNYLRGNKQYEDRSSNDDGSVNTRLYRVRDAVLGDLVDSTPVFVGPPKANLADPGYGPDTSTGSFKTANLARAGTIYIGSNDGMLHAINASNGQERWAYVPSMVLDNLWKLADINYGDPAKGPDHAYYVDGDIVVNDVCVSGCSSPSTAEWKTILVAGLNAGGKGYFALDITNPSTPSLLWEFDETDDSDIGFSFGNPIITKKPDGTWVVIITSGYNNVNGVNPGKGFLYVLNASTGAIINKYGTNEGDVNSPSGLAEINAYIDDAEVNNQTRFVYAGDLVGNLWRFDITAGAGTSPFRVAILKDPNGVVQPITTRPELAEINGKPVLYVGTGRYLGKSDLNDSQQQTIYAIMDDISASPSTLNNPRNSSLMVNQTLVANTTTATRTIQQPANAVNFTSDRGWYIDFLDPKERQNVPAQLVFGTLLLPTTVPTNTDCSTGGYGWLNFLDYKTGAAVAGNIVSSRTNAPIVGMNVIYVNGKPVVSVVTADNPTPTFPPVQPSFTGGTASGFTNHRVIWRELIPDDQ